MINADNILITAYDAYLGNNREDHEMLKPHIKNVITASLLDADLNSINLYNFAHKHNNEAGNEKTFFIFINTTHNDVKDDVNLTEPLPINNIENDFTNFYMPLDTSNNIIIESENGVALAEYDSKWNQLNILFDLFKQQEDYINSLAIFEYILKELNKLVWRKKLMDSSWKNTTNREELSNQIKSILQKNVEENLKRDVKRLEEIDNAIKYCKRDLYNYFINQEQLRRKVSNEKEYTNKIFENLLKDIDLIIKMNKVDDIVFKDGKFIVYTNPLYIHLYDRRFYGGRYIIKINLHTSEIRFDSNTKHRSYWTPQDPHPHVCGSNGEACFGNISSTIAELCAQTQLYALVITLINFLESVNIEDVAGKSIYNWDEVDEDGNIIQREYNICDCCREEFRQQLYTAYNEIDEDEEGNMEAIEAVQICEDCRDNAYYFHEELEEYIRC